VLVKLFADRQLSIDPATVSFLVARMDRSFAGAGELVGELDRAALAQQRRITTALASEVLDKLQPKRA
jgi:chromosomal replication initiation ATPase DnaA